MILSVSFDTIAAVVVPTRPSVRPVGPHVCERTYTHTHIHTSGKKEKGKRRYTSSNTFIFGFRSCDPTSSSRVLECVEYRIRGRIQCEESRRKESKMTAMIKLSGIAILLVAAATAAPTATQEAAAQPSVLEQALDVYASCSGEEDVSVCLKLRALRFVDRVARSSADIEVADGFKIVETEEAKSR